VSNCQVWHCAMKEATAWDKKKNSEPDSCQAHSSYIPVRPPSGMWQWQSRRRC